MTRKELRQAVSFLFAAVSIKESSVASLPLPQILDLLAVRLWIRRIPESEATSLVREQLEHLHLGDGCLVFDKETAKPAAGGQ